MPRCLQRAGAPRLRLHERDQLVEDPPPDAERLPEWQISAPMAPMPYSGPPRGTRPSAGSGCSSPGRRRRRSCSRCPMPCRPSTSQFSMSVAARRGGRRCAARPVLDEAQGVDVGRMLDAGGEAPSAGQHVATVLGHGDVGAVPSPAITGIRPRRRARRRLRRPGTPRPCRSPGRAITTQPTEGSP